MTQQTKEQLEEVIKKNLPEEKIISNIKFNSIQEDYSCGLLEGEILGHNQCLSQINPSLIADEVLKVVVDKIEKMMIVDDGLYMNCEYNSALDDVLELLTNSSTLGGEQSEHLSRKENK